MGEILQDSRCYILQWMNEYYDDWQSSKYSYLKEAKRDMARFKALDKKRRVKSKWRIIKEITKQEVVYDE